jgi:hypothetical protein
LTLAETNSRAAAVLVDEFDPCLPEETPADGEIEVIHTLAELVEQLDRRGMPLNKLGRACLDLYDKRRHEQEHSGTVGLTSSTDDHCVEDDTSDDSDRGK